MAVHILHYSDLETAFDTPERIGRLAGLIQSLSTPDTVIADTGDTLAPSLLSLETYGQHALEFFTRIQPDVATFGNHDFDIGLERLKDIVAASPQTWLGTNIFHNGQQFGESVGVQPDHYIEINETVIGFFGVLTPDAPAMTPEAESLTVTDPVATATETATALRDNGADQVIALSHLGATDEQVARHADVDVILGGHVHSPRVDRIAGTLHVRPGVNGDRIYDLSYDEEWSLEAHSVLSGPLDESMAATVKNHLSATGFTAPVTEIHRPIDRAREAIFTGDTPLGQIVAEAYRWATDADIGLQNSGGLRDGPPLQGEVTGADLVGIIPFDEPVAVAEVPGHRLTSILEATNGQHAPAGHPDWQLGHTSGVTLHWENDTLTDVRVDGKPVKHDTTYRLATSAYLFWTDREFPALSPEDCLEQTDRRQYEILVDYARTHGLHQPQGVES